MIVDYEPQRVDASFLGHCDAAIPDADEERIDASLGPSWSGHGKALRMAYLVSRTQTANVSASVMSSRRCDAIRSITQEAIATWLKGQWSPSH